MLINCEKAAEICDKAQYHEASIWQRVLLRTHHILCVNCRKHAVKNGKLTKLCSKAKLKTMDETKKQEIKQQLNNQTLNN